MNCSFPKMLTEHEVRAIYLQSAQIAIRRREFSEFNQGAPLIEVPSGSKVWRLLLRFGIRAVGPINQSLVARCSTLASGKRERARMNRPDQELLSELFTDFANSPLSSLCYGAYMVSRAVQEGNLSRCDLPTRHAFDLSESWQAARPIRLSNGMQVVSASGRRHLPDLWHSQGHDASVISMVMACLSRSGELSALFLPWAMRQLDGPSKCVTSPLVPAEDIHGVMSYGLNGQTKIGRASLALYLANSKAMQAVIPCTRSPDRAVWFVSQILKRVEADPIAEELIPSELIGLSDLAADTIGGLDRQRVRDARAILTDEIGLLNACRREVLSHAR